MRRRASNMEVRACRRRGVAAVPCSTRGAPAAGSPSAAPVPWGGRSEAPPPPPSPAVRLLPAPVPLAFSRRESARCVWSAAFTLPCPPPRSAVWETGSLRGGGAGKLWGRRAVTTATFVCSTAAKITKVTNCFLKYKAASQCGQGSVGKIKVRVV